MTNLYQGIFRMNATSRKSIHVNQSALTDKGAFDSCLLPIQLTVTEEFFKGIVLGMLKNMSL